MTTGLVQEHNLVEKQIGCMAGFLQIFDRHQILAGKRIYSAKRLPPAGDSESESEMSSSPAVSKEFVKPEKSKSAPSPDRSAKKSPRCDLRSPEVEKPAEKSPKSTKPPLPLPVFEFKEGTKSSWKFSREAPRLSLDSRATAILSANRAGACSGGAVEEIEKQRRSTSVIARLMGLEPPSPADPQPEKKSELRRSASESRVSRDLGNNFQFQLQPNLNRSSFDSAKSIDTASFRAPEKAQAQHKGLAQRKSFFDSQDIFPEPKQSVAIYGEIERRLKLRGIDEAPNDLETLKQILEALQLKGLLHSAKPPNQRNDRRRFSGNDSPIVIVTPARSPASANRNIHDSPPPSFRSRPGARRNLNNLAPEIYRNVRNRAGTRSPIPNPSTGGDRGVKSPNGKKPLNIETHRKRNQSTDQRRLSPVHSPKLSPRRTVSDHQATNKSPKYRKPISDTVLEAESSSISESSISNFSIELQRSKMEEHREGKSLLERCDQLLLSIAEINATELQPSPVSVLDASSFYRDDSLSSPSPVAKRSIDFKGLEIELDDDLCSPEIPSPIIEDDSEDSDFVYIAEIFWVSGYLSSDSDVFQELEKRQFLKGNDTSKASRVERKLIFDTIGEILDRNRQSSTWKVVSSPNLQQTWSEFLRVRERDSCEEDLFEVICGVLRKDLAGDGVSGWADHPIEVSEAVLDIERLVFKDLVGETIRELSSFGGNCGNVVPSLRRKLVF